MAFPWMKQVERAHTRAVESGQLDPRLGLDFAQLGLVLGDLTLFWPPGACHNLHPWYCKVIARRDGTYYLDGAKKCSPTLHFDVIY